MKTSTCFLTGLLVLLFFAPIAQGHTENHPSPYQLVWTTPGEDYHGTVPLGNGEIGLNAWFTSKGELHFFISRTDSWDDYGRLVKVGALQIKGLATETTPFRQVLDVEQGTLLAKIGPKGQQSLIRVWVDANRPVIVVEILSEIATQPKLSMDLWRKTPGEVIPTAEVSDLFWDNKQGITVYPDTIMTDPLLQKKNSIAWYHHNTKTKYYDEIAKTQGLDKLAGSQDPFANRIFGAIATCDDPEWENTETLASRKGTEHRFEIAVHTMASGTPEEWSKTTCALLESAHNIKAEIRYAEHLKWWKEFRNRSWIHFSPRTNNLTYDNKVRTETDHLNQTYLLQRYVDACAGRGQYPIKFNGTIFTVPAEGKAGNADYRRWGPGYWWQNSRLPYFSKPMAGDFDMMVSFFKMYTDLVPLCQYRTEKYLGHKGAYFPECIYFWGAVFPETYGQEPWDQRTDKLQSSGWHKWEWVGGLELVLLMFNYYEFTQDDVFLQKQLLPVARAILQFFNCHYPVDATTGKMKMHPSQSLETWWDCDNPMPEIAGIRSVIERLQTIPKTKITDADSELWTQLYLKTPEPPTRVDSKTGRKMLAAAERFAMKRNVENPELYAVFPFRLFAFEKPNADWARNALDARTDRGCFGWRQEDLFMAWLGQAENAKNYLIERAFNKDKNSRFPVFWGPGYDWVPDQDHGSILTATAQSLVLQTEGKNIYLLPALPKEWDVEFKLHAPYSTIITGRTQNGKIVELNITPPERRNDVHIF